MKTKKVTKPKPKPKPKPELNEKFLCSCGLNEKVDGEYYCQPCLNENPFRIA